MVKNKVLLLVLSVLVFVSGCRSAGEKAPDVSHIPMPVHIFRFDTEFVDIDSNRVLQSLSGLHRKYPVFLPVYLENIMNFGPYSDTGTQLRAHVRAFITAKDIRLLQDTVDARFPSLEGLQAQLQQGFRYIKYYFPAFHPPRIVTFISGLANYGAVTADTVLGIGLDMFLGSGFTPYTKVANPYPGYMLYQFSPRFIAADCYKVLQQQMYPMRSGGTLLDLMIAYGKQLYFLDKIMPDAPDSVKIGYTGRQLAWCKGNEQYIWQYLVQNNLLYIHDMQRIMHYIGPGPSTQGMPPPAPGDIGSWIGWQIVRKYMAEHPETTLKQLMELGNSQQILSEARYRPH